MTYTAPLLTSLGHLADFVLSLPATFGIKDSIYNVDFQIGTVYHNGCDIQWKDESFTQDGHLFEERSVELVRIHRAGSPGFYGRWVTPQALVNLINTSEIEARFADNDARYSWAGGEGEHRAVGHKWAIDILSDDQPEAELAAERRVHALHAAFETFVADPSKATQDALNRAALDYRVPGFTVEVADK